MNKRFTQNILKFVLLIVIALSSGCGQSTAADSPTLTPAPSQTVTPSPTNTPEPIHPEGVIFYDASNAIYSVDLKTQQTKTIFELKNAIQPLTPVIYLIADEFIYASIPPSKDAERPGIFRINLVGSGIEQQITERGIVASSVNPTAQYFTYFNGQGDLYLLDLKENKSQLIIEQSGKYGLAQLFRPISWSPDGQKLIYDAYGLGSYDCELFIYDVTAKKSTALLPDERTACFAAWSPDGKKIAIANDVAHVTDQSKVYILNIETDTLEKILISDGIQFSGLGWLSDGESLLIGAEEKIYLYNETDGNLEVISDYPDWTQNFISSPDKNMVLYEQSNVHGDAKTDLYLFNAANKTTKKIYSHPGVLLPPAQYLPQPYHITWDYSPIWSPDTKYVAYFTTPEPENYSRTSPRPIFLNIYSIETGGTVSFEIPAKFEIHKVYWIYS